MLKALNLLTRQSKAESIDLGQSEFQTARTDDSNEVAKKIGDFASSETPSAIINVEENHTVDALEEIHAWIEQIPFSRPRRNIARDFSDGVFMAELLKRYYPRHVDLHNYTSRNSIAYKIENWTTLNRKVLSKIGMKLSKDVIVRLAYSQPGVIESVLADLRTKILKDSNAERDSLYFDYETNGKGETVKSVLNFEEVTNKTVPRQAFVKLKHELQEKKSEIDTLNEKVSHLESLIKLKNQRITDLTTQIMGSVDKSATPRSKITENGTAKYRLIKN